MSIMFNQICINEEMLPKYTYFKLHDPAAHKYNSTLEYRCDLVKRQITLSKNNIHKSTNTYSYKVVMFIQKPHHFCNTSSPDDGPKLAESTWEITNYRRFINQFLMNIIRSIRQFKLINQKMSIMFNKKK